MAIYLLDGIMCPAFYLTGNPRRAAYIKDTPEGQNDTVLRVSNSLVFVPADNGASWTAANGPTGAHMVLAAPDDLDTAGLQAVNDRLVEAYNNVQRVAAERGTAPPFTPEPIINPNPPAPTDDRPTWQQLGYASKAEWVAAGRPQP